MAIQQFDKWWDKNKYGVFHNGMNFEYLCRNSDNKDFIKVGWKAALEWALSLQWETDDGTKAISSARLKRELDGNK